MREEKTESGIIKIHKDVVASISAIATEQIDGVVKIGANLKGKLFELFFKKSYGNIKVEIDKNNDLKIDIPVIIKFGYNVSEVAAKIQNQVSKAIETMTDLRLKEINVTVSSIEKESKNK